MTTYYPPRNTGGGAAPATPTTLGTVYGHTSDIDTSVSIGRETNIATSASTAIGTYSTADTQGVSVGISTNSYNSSVAIGYATAAIANGAIAMGINAMTNSYASVVIGANANSSNGQMGGQAGISIGYNADSTDTNISIGSGAVANAPYSMAIGAGANAGDNASEGTGRYSIGDYSVAGNYSVSLGYQANSNEAALAIGSGAIAKSASVAIGSGGFGTSLEAKALAESSVAIGSSSKTDTTAQGSISIGASANNDAGSFGSVAIGPSASNTNGSNDSIAIGNGAAVIGGDQCTAVGQSAQSQSGDNNTAIGSTALIISGSGEIAVGRGSIVHGSGGGSNIAIGMDAFAGDVSTMVQNSVALGYGSSVLTDNTIVLGNSSTTDLQCNVQTISALSDARDKTNVQPLNVGLDFINQLNPVTFDWDRRDGSMEGKSDFGFIAQELAAAEDSIGMADTLGLTNRNDPEKLLASYGKLVPILVQAVKDLSNEVNELKEKLK